MVRRHLAQHDGAPAKISVDVVLQGVLKRRKLQKRHTIKTIKAREVQEFITFLLHGLLSARRYGFLKSKYLRNNFGASAICLTNQSMISVCLSTEPL